MSGPRVVFLAALARLLSAEPEPATAGFTSAEWAEVAQALESHQRLAAALNSLLDYTLACELVIYDVGEQHDEHPAVAAARAALREAGADA